MEVVTFAQASFYAPPDHEEIVARRLQGGEASTADFATVGHSTFPAGAAIAMGAGSFGRIYVVTQGALTVEQADGVRHLLNPGDSIFIAPGEARAMRNEGGETAEMIVVTPPQAR